MKNKVPAVELQMRMSRFRREMEISCPEWKMVVIFSKVNQYYFTGTMQDGILVIPRNEEATYWVRRSYERAMDESLFPCIKPMKSFRDAAQAVKVLPEIVYTETEVVPLALYRRFIKYFPFEEVRSADSQIMAVRAVKSEYELSIMKKAGEIHRRILEERVPEILKEGMSEAELAAKLFFIMIEEGHHGVARFGMFDTDISLGHVAFGESSIYPTFFDGPGGNYGMCPAVPFFGSRENLLKKGDLVFVDVAFGIDGYHTDKTMIYMFGKPLSNEVIAEHYRCLEIQNKIAEMLIPDKVPSEIYHEIMNSIDNDFLKNFMGFGERKVKFLGHGIGLTIDETPIIANGFSDPIKENMLIALEPKKGIEKVGMVGVENTFLVTKDGGKSITGNHPGLILV